MKINIKITIKSNKFNKILKCDILVTYFNTIEINHSLFIILKLFSQSEIC
jgi:hypothetical protein